MAYENRLWPIHLGTTTVFVVLAAALIVRGIGVPSDPYYGFVLQPLGLVAASLLCWSLDALLAKAMRRRRGRVARRPPPIPQAAFLNRSLARSSATTLVARRSATARSKISVSESPMPSTLATTLSMS